MSPNLNILYTSWHQVAMNGINYLNPHSTPTLKTRSSNLKISIVPTLQKYVLLALKTKKCTYYIILLVLDLADPSWRKD
jgi:hypothetical protein